MFDKKSERFVSLSYIETGGYAGLNRQKGGIMRIKKIESQLRRDFWAVYECEHCGHTKRGSGYDDMNFHRNVIPNMICPECGETSPEDYRPMETKYPEYAII